jgi:siderophore synthetase component
MFMNVMVHIVGSFAKETEVSERIEWLFVRQRSVASHSRLDT